MSALYIDGEPDDAIASKLIPAEQLMANGAWQDPAEFDRRYLEPFKQRIRMAKPALVFQIEAYGLGFVFEPTIMLVARPLGAEPLE